MELDLIDFSVLGAGKTNISVGPSDVGFAVYRKKDTDVFQLNIKIGSRLLDQISLGTGKKIDVLYNPGKHQIILMESERGYTLRPDGSLRRNINKSWHQEPFPEKEMSIKPFSASIVDTAKGKSAIFIQLPENHKE